MSRCKSSIPLAPSCFSREASRARYGKCAVRSKPLNSSCAFAVSSASRMARAKSRLSRRLCGAERRAVTLGLEAESSQPPFLIADSTAAALPTHKHFVLQELGQRPAMVSGALHPVLICNSVRVGTSVGTAGYRCSRSVWPHSLFEYAVRPKPVNHAGIFSNTLVAEATHPTRFSAKHSSAHLATNDRNFWNSRKVFSKGNYNFGLTNAA